MCVWTCAPFAPLSHDSCCTSWGFRCVWSVCGLALHNVNAVFSTIALKLPLLTVWVGNMSFCTCAVLVCCVLPPLALFLIRTVTTPWLRKRCLLCVFVFQQHHLSFLCQSQSTFTEKKIPHTGGHFFSWFGRNIARNCFPPFCTKTRLKLNWFYDVYHDSVNYLRCAWLID